MIVPGKPVATAPDQSLIRVLARAHQGLDRMNSDPEFTVAELAREEGFNRSYVSRLIRLILLAPDIVAAVLEGWQPVALTANKLMADTRLPVDMAAQRRALGFA